MAQFIYTMHKVRKAIKADPNRRAYMDLALTPVPDEELETLDMFKVTDAARASAAKAKKMAEAAAQVA